MEEKHSKPEGGSLSRRRQRTGNTRDPRGDTGWEKQRRTACPLPPEPKPVPLGIWNPRECETGVPKFLSLVWFCVLSAAHAYPGATTALRSFILALWVKVLRSFQVLLSLTFTCFVSSVLGQLFFQLFHLSFFTLSFITMKVLAAYMLVRFLGVIDGMFWGWVYFCVVFLATFRQGEASKQARVGISA